VAVLACALGAAVLAGCTSGSDPSAPEALLVSWAGDFESAARPVLSRPGEVPVAFGPAALEYHILRISPDGASVAAIVSGWEGRDGPALVVFSVDDRDGPSVVDAGDLAQAQDLAWSPDGRRLALVGATSAVIAESEGGWQVTARYAGAGRLFGPLGGDIWAPDSSGVALGVSDGVTIIRPGEEPLELEFDVTPFSPRAAAFAGWLEDEILVRDFATDVYYSHPAAPSGSGAWMPTIPADPQAELTAAVERAATYLAQVLPGATISSTRPTADRGGVVVTGWTAESEEAIRRGPFLSAAAVAALGGEPVTFDLGKVRSFGVLAEGRLIDAVFVR